MKPDRLNAIENLQSVIQTYLKVILILDLACIAGARQEHV